MAAEEGDNSSTEPPQNITQLVARHISAADTNYVCDKMASEHGHRVVRLPPYHCQYNTTELVWAQLKGYAAKRNTVKIAELKPLIQEAIEKITLEKLQKRSPPRRKNSRMGEWSSSS